MQISIIDRLKRFWQEHPLASIVLLALIPRLVAVVLSKGYGMHDDHFGPIEQPFIIMNDITYWTSRTTPHGHSIVYPSIHYVLFQGFEAIGIRDPQAKMYLVRFLHGLGAEHPADMHGETEFVAFVAPHVAERPDRAM